MKTPDTAGLLLARLVVSMKEVLGAFTAHKDEVTEGYVAAAGA
jgi:hypothetical protein